jgi:thioredoxin reductase
METLASPTHDVLVIGGGAAGRSAALVLGRARRTVALVDTGQPSNRASTGIGGFLGQDRRPPQDFYDATREELSHYPTIGWHHGTVVDLSPVEPVTGGWRATLDDTTTIDARRVVLAAGMRYDIPDIDGIEPLWGASVFHCPFCHGWEHRDQPLLMLAGGPEVAMRAKLLRNWSDDLTVVAPPGSLSDGDRNDLATAGIPVADGEIARLHTDGETRELAAAELSDGTRRAARGLLVPAPHKQRSDLIRDLGLAVDESDHVVVDAFGRTSIDGVWAVGDLVTPMALVAVAVARGAQAATDIVRSIVTEPVPSPAGVA